MLALLAVLLTEPAALAQTAVEQQWGHIVRIPAKSITDSTIVIRGGQ